MGWWWWWSTDSLAFYDNSTADLYGVSVTNSTYNGLVVARNSNVSAPSSTITNNTNANVVIDYASSVCLTNTSMSGGTCVYGLFCQRGSRAEASGSSASGTSSGYCVAFGGIIDAASTVGTKNQTVNTITANGIIFG